MIRGWILIDKARFSNGVLWTPSLPLPFDFLSNGPSPDSFPLPTPSALDFCGRCPVVPIAREPCPKTISHRPLGTPICSTMIIHLSPRVWGEQLHEATFERGGTHIVEKGNGQDSLNVFLEMLQLLNYLSFDLILGRSTNCIKACVDPSPPLFAKKPSKWIKTQLSKHMKK